MQSNSYENFIKAFLFFFIIFLSVYSCAPSTSPPQTSKKLLIEFQNKLNQRYEINADELMSLIRKEQFEKVELFINYVIKNDYVTRDGFRYFKALLGYWFTKPNIENHILPKLNIWVKNYPQSDIAHIVRGAFYIDHAWKARGSGWAKDVKKEAWNIFHERMALGEADIKKAYELNPKNPHSTRQLMRIESIRGKSQKEKEVLFNRVIAQVPTFYWAYLTQLTDHMPKWGGTWEAMFQFANETKNNAPPKTLLPLILVKAHQEAAARSKNKKQYYNIPGVWNEIDQIYKQIITDFPKSGMWKTEFGRIANGAGKIKLAKRYWQMAIKSDPYYYKTYKELAKIYAREHQWELSEKYARKLIELYPKYANGYKYLAVSLQNQNKFDLATKNFKKAIEVFPGYAAAYISLGNIYNAQDKYLLAIDQYVKAIEINPNNYVPYNNLAWVLATGDKNSRNGTRAISIALKALGLKETVTGISVIGAAYVEDKQYEKAIETYNKVFAQDKTFIKKYQNYLKKMDRYSGNIDGINNDEFKKALRIYVIQGNYLQ